jgi:hypothetical protein
VIPHAEASELRLWPLFNCLDASVPAASPPKHNPYLIKDGVYRRFKTRKWFSNVANYFRQRTVPHKAGSWLVTEAGCMADDEISSQFGCFASLLLFCLYLISKRLNTYYQTSMVDINGDEEKLAGKRCTRASHVENTKLTLHPI